MLELIYFTLSAYGITQILIYGSIFNSIRPTKGKLGELFRCPMCLGFWIGILLWSINPYTQLFSFDLSPVTGFLLACVSSATSYVLAVTFDDYGIKIDYRK